MAKLESISPSAQKILDNTKKAAICQTESALAQRRGGEPAALTASEYRSILSPFYVFTARACRSRPC